LIESVLSYMPLHLKEALQKLSKLEAEGIEEIRVRINRPVELVIQNQSYFLTSQGRLSSQAVQGIKAENDDAQKIMNLISRHSIYAIEDELRRGYITVNGGHRVGIVGRAITENGKVKLLRDIKSFNFRIAKEIKGIARNVLPFLFNQGEFLNTLLISPPRCGKTTLLRDLIRELSTGCPTLNLNGQKLGIVDERSEIANCLEGVPQHDLGPRVDVLDACPKAEGMMMLIRSMSPDIIATDEIGSVEDSQAILEAIHSGVRIMTTVHGASIEDIKNRPGLRSLFSPSQFERLILLSKSRGVGTVEAIYDREGRKLSTFERGGIYA